MARMFNADGTPATPEFQVNTTGAGDQYQPSITALEGGGFFIAWTDNSRGVDTQGDDTSSYAIRGQVFDAEGDWVGSEFRVNLVTTYGQVQPDVLALADGRFIVAYSDTSSGTETGGDDTEFGAIRARIFNADGSPDSDEFLVNVTTIGHQNEPQMTQLPDSRVVFTWSDYSYGVATDGDDPSNGAIRARILDLRESAADWVGSAGDDDFTGTCWNDVLAGADGNDTLMGVDGDDKLLGKGGDDSLTGGLGNDVVRGGDGRDTLSGDQGADKLFGGSAGDTLLGGDGADRIKGNNGRDNITGGVGADLMTGGNGTDTFIFMEAGDSRKGPSGRDIITDFDDGVDKLDFSAIDADIATVGNDPLRFLGHDSFTGTPGEIRFSHNSKKTMIKIDLDGDMYADMKIELTDWHQLEPGDFIL
jgi:Ca2+-binding RTX toxin-like protein